MSSLGRCVFAKFAFLSLACAVLACGATRLMADQLTAADHIVIRKAAHRLYLYGGDRLLGEYHISLGLSPEGQKEREHDFRTPEGHYRLGHRNARSDYFLAIQVTYPNDEDERRARLHHWAPGGSIMIHGLPNTPRHTPDYYGATDWTDGCIALSNSDMVEIWMRTQEHIPIDIFP
jgi:murein L,D-transpeptidase YafK